MEKEEGKQREIQRDVGGYVFFIYFIFFYFYHLTRSAVIIVVLLFTVLFPGLHEGLFAHWHKPTNVLFQVNNSV